MSPVVPMVLGEGSAFRGVTPRGVTSLELSERIEVLGEVKYDVLGVAGLIIGAPTRGDGLPLGVVSLPAPTTMAVNGPWRALSGPAGS